jgi:hypothetical protein
MTSGVGVLRHTLTYLGHLGLTSDKVRQLGWKVVRANGLGRAKWRKLVSELRVAELHHTFGAGQIPNRMRPNIGLFAHEQAV